MTAKKLPTNDSTRRERRDAPRRAVETLLPARLLIAGNEHDLTCRIVDVSGSGLCVEITEDVVCGTELVFVTLPERFQLAVAWCRVVGPHRYHCGLRLTAGKHDLRHVFASFLPAVSEKG